MPHQTPNAAEATDQNAAVSSGAPNDQGREQNASARPEPRSYAAPEVSDSSLAPPAAGEVADFMDEGDPLDGEAVHQGGDRTAWPDRTEARMTQGPKTVAANRARLQNRDGQG